MTAYVIKMRQRENQTAHKIEKDTFLLPIRCSTLISIDSIFPFLLRRNEQTKKSIPAIFNRSRNKKFNQSQRRRTIHLANQSLGQIHVARAKRFPRAEKHGSKEGRQDYCAYRVWLIVGLPIAT